MVVPLEICAWQVRGQLQRTEKPSHGIAGREGSAGMFAVQVKISFQFHILIIFDLYDI